MTTPSHNPQLIRLLLDLKGASDRRDYDRKHSLARMLIRQHPDQFLVDSEEREIMGVTHQPTGFQFHLPRSVGQGLFQKAAFLEGYVSKSAMQLDISIGDILLGGRFKNIREVVKEIGEDDLGQPTVNGKKLLTSRIEKKLPKDKQSKETQEKTAAVDQEVLRDAAKRYPSWRVSGLVQGALNDDPGKYNLSVEEEFPDDPWIASLGSAAPMTDQQFQRLVTNYSEDPDGDGKPFYFVARKEGAEPVVIFQGNPNPMSIDAARKYGKQLGLPEEQLDFKHSLQKTAAGSETNDQKTLKPGMYVSAEDWKKAFTSGPVKTTHKRL
jgi:hypothetical protein